MKKQHPTKIIYLALVLLFGGLASFYFFQTKSLKKQLQQEIAQQNELTLGNKERQELMQIDAMVIDREDYTGALKAYQEKYASHDPNTELELKLRISLTEQLLRLRERPQSDSSAFPQQKMLDSLKASALLAPKEIQQYDSLNFALEKAKVQLTRLRRQLKQRSFGEYLTFTNAKGSQIHYVGQVKNNQANGYGVAILSTGSRYEGEWKNNQRHGEGSFFWPDGEYYVGHYFNDKRSGEGTYHWPNGEKFVGLWKDDERTGEGAFYGKKGDVVASGVWEDDELVQVDKSHRK